MLISKVFSRKTIFLLILMQQIASFSSLKASSSLDIAMSISEKYRAQYNLYGTSFEWRIFENQFNKLSFPDRVAKAETLLNSLHSEFDLEKFEQFVVQSLNYLNSSQFFKNGSSVLDNMYLHDLVGILKTSRLLLQYSDDILVAKEIFYTQRTEDLLNYIEREEELQWHRLQGIARGDIKTSKHYLLGFFRIENDLLYILQMMGNQISLYRKNDDPTFQRLDRALGMSKLRVRMAANMLIKSKGLSYFNELIEVIVDENPGLVAVNTLVGNNFDMWGRFGQCGSHLISYRKFIGKLERLKWEKTKEFHSDITEQIFNMLKAGISYSDARVILFHDFPQQHKKKTMKLINYIVNDGNFAQD